MEERIIASAYAAKIALSCGQIKKLHYWEDELDSSDLFDIIDED